MATVFEWIYVVGAVVLLFGAAIAIHEWGHFWVALKRGLKVEAFAIGFGPKIWGWTKDGIEYSIRWIPAGGYVKLPQMLTSEAIEGAQDKSEPLPPVSPWSKILVAFAGPLMNLIFAFVLATIIYFCGLPILVNPPFIGRVDPESAEGKLGIREGDRIVEVNGNPVRSWQDITFETATARTNVLPVVIERDGKRTPYQLTTRTGSSLAGLKWLNLDPREHPIIGSVQPDMPAAAAGMKGGDKFVSFNSVPVLSQEHLIDLVGKSEGKQSEVVVLRKGERMTFQLTPKYDPEAKRGRIGVIFGGGIYELQKPGPLPWEQVSDVVKRTFGTLGALIHSKETGVKAKDLSGPIGIFSMLAIQVKTHWLLALSFMVLLNVNLAVLNLLPVPVLDGGHIVMSIIESIRRKPLSARFVEYTTTAFAVALLSFMLYVTFFDLKRMPFFKTMFNQETQVEPGQKKDAPAPAPATTPAPEPVPAKQ